MMRIAPASPIENEHWSPVSAMDAIAENIPQIEPDLRTASRWPDLARTMLERHDRTRTP